MEMHMPSRFWKNLPEGRRCPAWSAPPALGARRIGQAQAVGARAGRARAVDRAQATPARAPADRADAVPPLRAVAQRHAGRRRRRPGAGAQLMLVGEQPGDQEDLAGQPFVGPAGKLLDRALQEAGIDRDDGLPHQRGQAFQVGAARQAAHPQDPGAARGRRLPPVAGQELAAVAPVVVALGSTALRALTGRRDLSLSAVQGQVLEVDGRRIVPTWHPSYVLRLPGREEQDTAFQAMLAALLLAKKLLAENIAQV